jgi:hypothetical protein
MRQVTPETTQEYMTQLKRFNMGSPGESDCPVFDGMYEYFSVSALARCNVQHELGHCCTAAAVCVCACDHHVHDAALLARMPLARPCSC